MTPFVILTHEALAYAYLYVDRPKDALQTAWHAVSLGGSQTALMYATVAGAHEGLGNYDVAAGAWRVATKKRGGDLWLYWAMLARALASGGHTDEALMAADTARARIRGNKSLEQVVAQLEDAIKSGCYPRAGRCDVLSGWIITVPGSTPGLANSNASAKSNAKRLLGPVATVQ